MVTEIRSLKDQLGYLVDELTAQRPLFYKISDTVLSEQPPSGISVRAYYEKLLFSDRDFYDQVLSKVLESEGGYEFEELPAEIDALLVRIIEMRTRIVDDLPSDGSKKWSEQITFLDQDSTLLQRAYQVALNDATTLRAITMQLSEIRHIFRQ